ncbi:cytochrome P450 [Aspergillus carlsbadensis]|nr:cytochrome P450 [Aspergillus carlsbadensis]
MAFLELKFSDGIVYSVLLLLLSLLFQPNQANRKLPLVNGKKPFEISGYRVRHAFVARLPQLLQTGLEKADVFRLRTPTGTRVVLAPRFADEVASHPALSPGTFFSASIHGHLPGFEALSQTSKNHVVQDAVRTRLTRSLDWHEVSPATGAVHIISRLMSLILVGEKVGQDPEWLDIVVRYSSEVFLAAGELDHWPTALRSLVARFSPSCVCLRQYIKRARAILLPVIQERATAQAAGTQGSFDDAIQWLADVGEEGKYDPVLSQFVLAIASIHTTSDLLNQVLLDICHRDDGGQLVSDLREEIVSALEGTGWQKSSLTHLKLIDSVLKESHRMKPSALLTLGRQANADVQLSDGTTIPRGSLLCVADVATRDPTAYPNPNTYDPYRFVRLLERGGKSAYFASPSAQHLGFGLGGYACPGRFFASSVLKTILCHMLLRYDLKPVGGAHAEAQTAGLIVSSDRAARIAVRRRGEGTASGIPGP